MATTGTTHLTLTELKDRLFELARTELEATGDLDDETYTPTTVVTERIWGPECDPTLFGRLADQVRDELDEATRELLESLRDGFCDIFPLAHQGDATFLLHPTRGFVARAIEGETPTLADVEHDLEGKGLIFAHATILPESDHLCYSFLESAAVVQAQGMEDAWEEAGEQIVSELAGQGRICRTPADLAEVKRIQRESAISCVSVFAPVEPDASWHPVAPTSLAPGQHRGKLAGLAWETRERLVAEHCSDDSIDDLINKDKLILFACARADQDLTGFSARDMVHEKLHSISPETIKETLAGMHIEIDEERKRDSEALVDAFERYVLDHAHFTGDVIMTGVRGVRDLRRALDAGGVLRVPLDEVHGAEDVPRMSLPASLLFVGEDAFSLVVLKEAREALADADWDEMERLAAICDEVDARLSTLCDFCGVLDAGAVASVIAGYSLDVDEYLTVLRALQTRSYTRDDHFKLTCIHKDCMDSVCAVHPKIAADAHLKPSLAMLPPKIPYRITRVMRAQAPIRPRTLEECAGYADVASYVRSLPSWRALVTYLDAHVPEGEDDMRFADGVAESLLDACRYATNPFALKRICRELSASFTDEQMEHLCCLANDLANHLPCWEFNGRSAVDVAVRATLAKHHHRARQEGDDTDDTGDTPDTDDTDDAA